MFKTSLWLLVGGMGLIFLGFPLGAPWGPCGPSNILGVCSLGFGLLTLAMGLVVLFATGVRKGYRVIHQHHTPADQI